MTTMLHHMKKTGALLCVPLLLVIGCTDGTITVQERQQGPGENTVDPNKPGSPGNPSNPNNPGNPTEPGNPTDPTRMKPGEIVPGRVTIRRLNRAEYNNTVRDLLWTQSEPANEFPADDYGYGFNNIGDTLTVSPLLMELYEKSADALVEEVFASRGSDGKSERFEAEVIQGSVGAARGEFWNLYSNGEVIQRTETTARGTYTISARAYGTQAGGEPAKMAFLMDGKAIKEVDVPVESGNPMVYSAQVDVEPGQHFFGVAFTNDFYDAAAGADRNLYVDWIEVTSPMQAPGEKSPWTRIMVCEDETPACAGQIFSTFGRRAWRRPMKQAEVDRLVQFLDVAKDNQLSFEEGVALGLKAMLLSPHFIFRPELDRAEIGEVHDINAHELATRLAYFLWSSTPDDTLLALAESGEILKEDVLRAQVERMLGDERANSLVSNYAAQWLYTDAVLDAQPDTTLFPDYNKQLAQDFRTEARMFAADFLLQDRDYRELLTGKYTYLNKRLADHYEIEGVEGDEFRRYEFTGDQRRGVLTQGGLLTARAYPNRTSPVLRGVWVMEEILCSEPPPPPPGVEGIEMQTNVDGLSIRERFELHSETDSSCFGCHQVMDPIGFALEQYDSVGRWKQEEQGKPVDASGKLPDGREFFGASEMAEVLSKDDLFAECLAEKMLVYATGRGMDVRAPGAKKAHGIDSGQVLDLAAKLKATNYSSRELIVQVVLSKAFRQRTPEPRPK